MNGPAVQQFLSGFRRQLILVRLTRAITFAFFTIAIFWILYNPAQPDQQTAWLLGGFMIILYMLLFFSSARSNRAVQTGNILLAAGRLDDAQVWLQRAISGFSLSAKLNLAAGQSLAAVYFQREAHQEVISICRELLRHRLLRRIQNVWVATRMMLTDSLLCLNRMEEAYEIMRPLYDIQLNLSDRLKLLPLQLRYELAMNHSASAVENLPEKVKLALDSYRAALVHALLAEACLRENQNQPHQLLARRAQLYKDLPPLAEKYPMITTIAENWGAVTEQPASADATADHAQTTDAPKAD